MSRIVALVLVVTLGLALGLSASSAATPHSSELWHVATITDPSNGKFTYCAVESSFDNGFSLALARNRDLNTNIVVTFPKPALPEHTKFHMDVVVDGGASHPFVGFSANTTTLVIPLQHDRAVIEALQEGKMLELKGPQDSIKFALDGANNALRQLESCVEKNLKAETANAGGQPEARPKVQAGPVAANTAPAEDAMVEPLPLPGQPTATPLLQQAPQAVAEAPKPTIMAQAQIQAAPAAAPAPTAPTGDEAQMQQDDEIAARAAAARLTAIREKAEADAKAKDDAAKADAEAARIAAAQQEQAHKEQIRQAAAAQQAKAQAQQTAEQDAQRQATDDEAAKTALAKLEAAQAAPQPVKPAQTPLTIAQSDRPPVSSQPLAVGSGPAATLAGLLRQAGLNALSVKSASQTYTFKSGGIAGEAIESRSRKPFLDNLLDNIDSLEKGCRGAFSSTLGAPLQRGDLTYAEVATRCGDITGVVLYYEKTGRFGMIAQESTAADKENAAVIRQHLEAGLASSTNYK